MIHLLGAVIIIVILSLVTTIAINMKAKIDKEKTKFGKNLLYSFLIYSALGLMFWGLSFGALLLIN